MRFSDFAPLEFLHLGIRYAAGGRQWLAPSVMVISGPTGRSARWPSRVMIRDRLLGASGALGLRRRVLTTTHFFDAVAGSQSVMSAATGGQCFQPVLDSPVRFTRASDGSDVLVRAKLVGRGQPGRTVLPSPIAAGLTQWQEVLDLSTLEKVGSCQDESPPFPQQSWPSEVAHQASPRKGEDQSAGPRNLGSRTQASSPMVAAGQFKPP